MKFFGIVVAALLATSAYARPNCGHDECPDIIVKVPAATKTIVVHPIVSAFPVSSAAPNPSPSCPPPHKPVKPVKPEPPVVVVPCHVCKNGSATTPGKSTALPKFTSGADRAVIAKGALCAVVVGIAGLLL